MSTQKPTCQAELTLCEIEADLKRIALENHAEYLRLLFWRRVNAYTTLAVVIATLVLFATYVSK